ncbi:Myohemerythrin, partial [Lamellibrachia satsuma]
MAFEIPAPYVWDESFRVFHDNIDAEHKAIFEAVVTCSKNPSSAAYINTFCKVTEDHFKDEEGMMKKAKYSDYINHQQIHNDFLMKIKTLKTPLDEASVSWVKQCFVMRSALERFLVQAKMASKMALCSASMLSCGTAINAKPVLLSTDSEDAASKEL